MTWTKPPVNTSYAAEPSQAGAGQQGIADFYVTIVCVGVGELWRSQFPACVQAGVWPSAPDIVHRQRWLPRLAHVQAGQLGLAVYGFRWRNPEQPPRNRNGSAYHSRAPLPIFRANAVFTELVIYRVTGTPYETSAPVPGIDPRFTVHIPFTPLLHLSDVDLAVGELSLDAAAALRASAVNASLPVLTAPTRLGPLVEAPPSDDGADRPLFVPGDTAGVLATP